MEWQRGAFTISTEIQKLDIPFIHSFLSKSYWAANIPVATIQRSIENSLSFGIYNQQQQVGFARVITDKATFAYLADVFVDDSVRGQGLSKWLMEVILTHPELQGLRRFMLATRDAHGLYRQFGFMPVTSPENLMSIHQPDIYKTNSSNGE
ncbi:MAG: GNAT family N-acetyltransferase [Chitinophagaceae bacterium]